MSGAAFEAFKTYFSSPGKTALILAFMLMVLVAFALLKVFKNGLREVHDERTDFDFNDLMTAFIRVLIVMGVLGIFFGL